MARRRVDALRVCDFGVEQGSPMTEEHRADTDNRQHRCLGPGSLGAARLEGYRGVEPLTR